MNSKMIRPTLLWSLLLSTLLLTACGGEASKTDPLPALPSPVAERIEDGTLVPDNSPRPPATSAELALLPKVSAGTRQYADSQVLLMLEGVVQAAEGAQIERQLWTQVQGPSVQIPRPDLLHTPIFAPDVVAPTRLEFRLTVEDDQGRVNSATTSIFVQPPASLVRVLSTLVQVSDLEAIFTLKLLTPLTETLTVDYTTLAGSALAGVDFVASSGSVSFAPGEQSQQVSVALITRSPSSEDRLFSLQLQWWQGEQRQTSTGSALLLGGLPHTELPPAELPTHIAFNALMGPEDSLLYFLDYVAGLQLIRSRDSECDLLNLFNCDFGLTDTLLQDTPLLDTSLTLANATWYWLTLDDQTWGPVDVSTWSSSLRTDGPPPRYNAPLIAFNERLLLIGGEDSDFFENNRRYFDLLTSLDGISWVRTVDNITGSTELDDGLRKVAEYNGELWVMDDTDGALYRSADTSTWSEAPAPPYVYRFYQRLIGFADQLLLIGDYWDPEQGGGPQVLAYTDAEGWQDLSDALPFISMSDAKPLVFDDRLWLIGNLMLEDDSSEPLSIWYSNDALEWVQVEPVGLTLTEGSGYYGFELVVFNDRIWLIGGRGDATDYMLTSQVWSSSNGIDWELINEYPGFSSRENFSLAAFNNKLWLFGGLDYNVGSTENPTKSDTWVTEDGVTWRKVFRAAFTLESDPDTDPNGETGDPEDDNGDPGAI